MKKALRLLSLLLISGLLLSACTVNLNKKPANQDNNIYEDKYDVLDKGPEKGGSLRLFSTPVDTLNPILTNNQYVQDFLGLVFEGLYKLDEHQQLVPVLAEGSAISPDGLKLTITLKKNITWQDKAQLKPEDVVFTINTILNTANNSVYAANLQNIASVAAGSDNSVVITLKKPDSLMLYDMTFPVIPMHYFQNEKINVKNSRKNLSPIGTGPYTFVSYNNKTGIKLKSNEDWWNKEGASTVSEGTGQQTVNTTGSALSIPYIQTVEIKIFPNSGAATTSFQSRDVDAVTADYNEFRKYIGRTDITLKRYPGKNYEFLSLNIKKGPMTDKNIRNAVDGFIDKQKLIDAALPGIAVSAELPVLPNSWIYQLVNTEQYQNTKTAKQLMTKSGYVLTGNNKYVSKSSSKAISLTLIVNQDDALRVNSANTIAAQLIKNGIAVQVEKLKWENVQNRIKSGSYDMAMLGYRISSKPDLSFAYSTENIKSGLNTAGYSNPAVDNYLQQILTQSDTEKQKSVYSNLLKTVLDDK
ncbi:MAG TPA: peptide ABC transporter substrate-binding protein, partial [Ruminiclostridium sp.]|nr:peptide ABC transporter substrate-binding protein [Ruminiclostridium sp.]